MTKQAAYQHLQQADALLHDADQDDPHVVAAHRLVHEAAAHLSESPEVREQAINLNPITVETDDEAQRWKWRLHWHAPGDWFEVSTVEQLKLLLGASIYQLRRVGSDEVYNCTGTSTYYAAPTPTPPQDGRAGEDEPVFQDGPLTVILRDTIERIYEVARAEHGATRPAPAAQPSAPAVQGEWAKFVDPIERRDAIRAVSAALEWPNAAKSAIKQAIDAIRALPSAPERQSKSSMHRDRD